MDEYQKKPRKFIEKYLKIRDKQARVIPLRLNLVQQFIWKHIQADFEAGRPGRYVVLKCRQSGVSTLSEALLFTRARLWPNTNCLVISHDRRSARTIFTMTKLMLDNLPPALRPMTRYETKDMIRFENPRPLDRAARPGLRSEIQVASAREVEIGRGSTLQAVHLSEFAWFKRDPGEVLDSVMNAVPRLGNTYVIVESTARAVGDHFHQLWQRALDPESEWTPIFIPWWMDPQYEDEIDEARGREILNELRADEQELLERFASSTRFKDLMRRRVTLDMTLPKLAWRRRVLATECRGSVSIFEREYATTAESCFISAGVTLFDMEALQYHFRRCTAPVRGRLHRDRRGRLHFIRDPRGPLRLWAEPDRDMQYVIGADPSLGVRVDERGREMDLKLADNAVACVLDRKKRQVAEFVDHIEPVAFADMLYDLGEWYNWALVYPEASGFGGGYSVVNRLRDRQYPLIGRERRWDRRAKEYKVIIGFEPNRKNVPILNTRIAFELYHGAYRTTQVPEEYRKMPRLQVYSRDLILECMAFEVQPDGSAKAAPGAKDDRVRALGLALLALDQLPEEGSGVRRAKSMRRTMLRRGQLRELASGSELMPRWMVL